MVSLKRLHDYNAFCKASVSATPSPQPLLTLTSLALQATQQAQFFSSNSECFATPTKKSHLSHIKSQFTSLYTKIQIPSTSKLHSFSPKPPSPTGGASLIILVHHFIHYTPLTTEHIFPNISTIEHLAIVSWFRKNAKNMKKIKIKHFSKNCFLIQFHILCENFRKIGREKIFQRPP